LIDIDGQKRKIPDKKILTKQVRWWGNTRRWTEHCASCSVGV